MRVLYIAAFSLSLSLGASVGLNLQKLSMNKEERLATQRPPYFQPLWLIGFAIQIVDSMGDFVFIGLAPQSLLAPLGALSLGFNVVLAPIFHPHEKVTRGIVLATALIYVGTILTVLHAPDVNPNYHLEILVGFGMTRRFLLYALACLSFQIGVVVHGRRKGWGIVHYCGLAGCFGGECILFAKSTSELVGNALRTRIFDDWTGSPLPYLFFVLMIGCALTNVNFLNQGLARFDALLVVPIYQSFWNAFGITGGLIFFQEYKHMTQLDGVMYAIGISITLVGVTLLVRERYGSSSMEDITIQKTGSTESLSSPRKSADVQDEGTNGLRRRRGTEEFHKTTNV